jgi:hypothetical protein|tara:strand:- start:943 stop:2436 length:1494 start_codon:yes stop_codon:yes gene_type:complete
MIHRSYFSKNNTILANSEVNTAKNPVTQLFYGKSVSKSCRFTGSPDHICNGTTGFTKNSDTGFSRFIFNLDLDDLKNKISDCCVPSVKSLNHTLKMTNTSNFDDTLMNDKILVDDTRRATSFTLMLFKAVTGNSWSEGVGYDYLVADGMFAPEFDLTYSKRPSNWFSSTTLSMWGVSGIYDNTDNTSYTVLATQVFDQGNENIEFNSNLLNVEVDNLLLQPTTITSANTYGIAFIPAFENLTGLTEAYSVGFFSRYTQTFYEPFLESEFNDVIDDNRGDFHIGVSNKLFLYAYDHNGSPLCFDTLPTVDVVDCNGSTVATYTAIQLTCGVYYIPLSLTSVAQNPPVIYTDVWSNLSVGGISQPNVTNEFIIYNNNLSIGSTAGEPRVYGYSVSGLKEDEKISTGETRKVFISTRVPYTVDEQVLVDNLQYRIYVTQGTTQVEVIPWMAVNKSFTHNYFLLDTGWMIPNEYYVDIKATSNQQVDIYRKVIKFQVINQI